MLTLALLVAAMMGTSLSATAQESKSQKQKVEVRKEMRHKQGQCKCGKVSRSSKDVKDAKVAKFDKFRKRGMHDRGRLEKRQFARGERGRMTRLEHAKRYHFRHHHGRIQ